MRGYARGWRDANMLISSQKFLAIFRVFTVSPGCRPNDITLPQGGLSKPAERGMTSEQESAR